jgi:NTE family protein
MAHLGALSVLVKAGIAIDYVAGCSAGALLGAVFCAGMPVEQILDAAPYIAWRRMARPVKSSQGLVTFDKMARWLVMMLGDVHFVDLEIPLVIVATDWDSGERVVLKEGRVAPAVQASCSIPGVVTPVELDGRVLVDGGIVDNLPVKAARELGADYVIGVDVFVPNYKRAWGPLAHGLTAIETLVRNAGGGVGTADFLISPKTAGRTYMRFSHYKELIALGEVATKDSLPCLLAEIDERYV